MRKWFRTAVLMIHGFSGSLSDNEYLVNRIQLDSRYDVYAWTLPGHNKDIINKVTRQDWLDAVDSQMELLFQDGYRKVIVIGHSMGGVLAGYLASKYKEIKKVVFVAGAFSYFSQEQYKRDLLHFQEAKNDPDASYGRLFTKLIRVPVKTLKEFQLLVKEKRDCIKQIKIPCLILHGDQDDVVPLEAFEYLKENIKSKEKTTTLIQKARHNVLAGKRKEAVTEYIYQFIKGGKVWKQNKKSVL